MNDRHSTQHVIVGENENYRNTSAQDRIDRKKREIERDRKLIRAVKSTLSRRKMLDSQRKKKK